MSEQVSGETIGKQSNGPNGRAHAKTTITVTNSKTMPFDQEASPNLLELRLSETFAGDIEGTSTVRALEISRNDHSAEMVSVQRVTGMLCGRRGTFVLQGSEKISNGKITATWVVVRGTGTDELKGLRGEGGFEGEFGKGSEGTLDYWFE